MNPALGPIWLDKVIETKSLLWLGRHDPAAALAFFAFVAAGCAAQVALWRRQRDGETGLLTSFVVLAALLACWQQKLMPYAAWLAVVPVAVWAAGLRDTRLLSATLLRIGAVVLVSQATLDTAFGRALAPRHGPGGASLGRIERADPQRACLQSASVARLTALPPGLIAGDIDLGPYVVALTPHRVVAAPYHRLETGIIANHVILAGAPAQAAYELRRLGVDYLALCAAPSGSGRNLRARLLDGQRFDFLREVDLGQGAPMRVWRVVP